MQYCRESVHHVVIDAPRLFRGAKLFFGSDVQRLLAPYESEPAENRSAYRRECEMMFDLLQTRFSPAAIILTADNFYWARELVTIARERGVKVLVVDKEGVITPHYFKAGADRYKKYAPFMSDHIFVYSDRQRDYWQGAGVAREQVSVVGQLRSDLFFKEHSADVDLLFPVAQPLITLFSYEDDAYITMLQKSERRTWRRMKEETHEAFYAYAKANPKYNFVVKTHPQQSDLLELQARYRGLSNLVVVGGSAIGNELIQRSELIIAFQTTGVIEAMFMDKRVIYSAWDPNYERFAPDILPYHEAPGIQIARSFGAFQSLCSRCFSGDWSDFAWTPEELDRRAKFVDSYLHNPDGHTCERFDKVLSELIA